MLGAVGVLSADEARTLADACLTDIESWDDWAARRATYRRQLLEMLGLDPMPERTDLYASDGTTAHIQGIELTGLDGASARMEFIEFYPTGRTWPARVRIAPIRPRNPFPCTCSCIRIPRTFCRVAINITAKTDNEAAFALGTITEFQRGPQLQFLKRLAQGRLSEMGGGV